MPEPKIYEHAFRVAADDIDRMGHVNNVVYLRYAQDAAAAHWFAAAAHEFVESLLWVVRRHEVDYLRPAFADDPLVARTWISDATAATLERTVEIRRPGDGVDGELVTRIKSRWVALDAKTLRPCRISDALRRGFFHEPAE